VNEEEREYLNETIRNLNNQLVDALRERNEARREVCELASRPYIKHAYEYAHERGWDCFKENNNG
jgi:hypothetical protein